MNRKSFLSLFLLYSTTFLSSLTYADTITVNNWDELRNNGNHLNKTYVLSDGVTPSGSFNVGNKDDPTYGSWNLVGKNVRLSGNYNDHKFAIMNNIDSFVFENLNIENFKTDGGWGGVIYNESTAKTAEVKSSTFTGNGAKHGGIIYNNGGNFSLIDNNTFKGNFINNGTGIVIYNNGTIGTISNNSFESNTAYGRNRDDNSYYTASALFNNTDATIKEIIGNTFYNNRAASDNDDGYLTNGAAIHNRGTIGEISGGSFEKNGFMINENGESQGYHASVGGAIYNDYNATITKIASTFEDNRSEGGGGAIFNDGTIENIGGSFSKNYVAINGGGAIKNWSKIETIDNSEFSGNIADGERGKGGAIYNGEESAVNGSIDNSQVLISKISNSEFYGNKSNDFGGAINNFAKIGTIENSVFGKEDSGNVGASGGAINNQQGGSIDDITGSKFAYNKALEITDKLQGNGGAIRNMFGSSIGTISGTTFDHNTARGVKEDYQSKDFITYTLGGAIYNAGSSIKKIIDSTFSNNSAVAPGDNVDAQGGAIYNGEYNDRSETKYSNLTSIETSLFENNSAHGTNAQGGAIYNDNDINSIVNTSFKGNYALATDTALGGAIYSSKSLNIIADNKESIFSDNYVQIGEDKTLNSIYMAGSDSDLLDLKLTANGEEGLIRFDDGIDGQNYNINLNGDSGVIRFNSTVLNAKNLVFSETAHAQLGVDARVNVDNMKINRITRADTILNPTLTVDIEVDRENDTVHSGLITVNNDLEGKYGVIVNSLNPDVLDDIEKATVKFLEANEDNHDTDASFEIARVDGSPFLWTGSTVEGEEKGTSWYLNLTDVENENFESEEEPGESDEKPEDKPVDPVKPTDPEKPVQKDVYAEVVAATGLHQAAIEQTRSVARHVATQVAMGREYCKNCGIYDYNYEGKTLRNVWVDVQGESANFDKQVDMDADIWGVEAGFDLQKDLNNTLGVFTSYRKGEYDLSGKANVVRSKVGSEIDIDSYLAGLYYRYDKNMNWAFATVYGGIQKADVKANDGYAKFDTDATEFGAMAEAGHIYALSKDWTFSPSASVSYTQLNYDNARDNVNKSYKWDDIKFVEAELGAKLERQFVYSKVYVKPSVVQTFTAGDNVKISGINSNLDTYKDQTLGRVEVGGRFGINDNLSGYVWANYTVGSSYEATAGGLGLSYKW